MHDKELHMQNKRNEKKSVPLDKVGELLSGMQYGTLELTVHDGRVVQIERRERVRIAT